MATYSFNIEGMSCDHCVRAVKTALEAIDGVEATEVTIGHADVTADPAPSRDLIVAAIEEEGFQVVL